MNTNPGSKPHGFIVINRNTGRHLSSFHGPNAFERACTLASEHSDTGYLSVCAMVETPTDFCHIDSANLRDLALRIESAA